MYVECYMQECVRVLRHSTRSFRVSGIEYRRTGRHVHSDYNRCVLGFSVYVCLLLDGASLFHSDFARSRGRITSVVENGDLSDLGQCCCDLDSLKEILLGYCTAHRPGEPADDLVAVLTGWDTMSDLTRLTKGLLIESARTSSVVSAPLLQWCLTMATCFNKLEVDRPDLAEAASSAVEPLEQKLAQLDGEMGADRRVQELLGRLYNLYKSHPIPGPLDVFTPRHGPGAVSEPGVRCSYEKYSRMHYDARIAYMLKASGFGMDDFIPETYPILMGEDRVNKPDSVPKNWKKRRSISEEPVALQYWQQAIKAHIYRCNAEDRWWRSRINYEDQTRSRDLARLGSLTGTWATIDLSAASDSVRLSVVKRVFGNNSLTRWLIATRSTHSLLGDGRLLRLHKFAPMGSGCCFPVETMIFALIAELAVRDTCLFPEEYRVPVVYGDDIIVPWYAVEKLREYLELLGFTINVEKSYSSGYFRESCGMWAWYGADVTPIQYKGPVDVLPSPKSRLTAESVPAIISYVNRYELNGYHNTSRNMLEYLGNCKVPIYHDKPRECWSCIEFSDDVTCVENGILYTCGDATNYRNPSRWIGSTDDGNAYQVREVLIGKPTLKPTLDARRWMRDHEAEVDDIRYLEWLLNHQVGLPLEGADLRDAPAPSIYSKVPKGETMVICLDWRIAYRGHG